MPYQHLRSTTPGNKPAALADGQIAVNQADRKLFAKGPTGAVEDVGALWLPKVDQNVTLFQGGMSDLNNPTWQKLNLSVTDGVQDPDGGYRAQTLFETTANSTHDLNRFLKKAAARRTYNIGGKFQPAGRTWLGLFAFGTGYASGMATYVNLSGAGAVGTVSPFAYGTWSAPGPRTTISLDSQGWYRVNCSFDTDATADLFVTWRVEASADTHDQDGYVGDVTKGITMWDLYVTGGVPYP